MALCAGGGVGEGGQRGWGVELCQAPEEFGFILRAVGAVGGF